MRNDVEFFVRDSGIGIKTEDQSKIFDRFVKVQSDENTAKTKGAGLGLSISKGIVKRLGGNIYVQSVLGKGTIFHFKLPYDRK
jgi:signal transduction histidine kinase